MRDRLPGRSPEQRGVSPAPRLNRRGLLTAAGLGVAGSSLLTRAQADPGLPTVFHSPDMAPFRDVLPPLPIVTGSVLDLAARTTDHRFHADFAAVPAMAYGASSYLGPIIEAHAEQPTRLTLTNQLGTHPFAADIDTTLHGVPPDFGQHPRTSLHLHGGVNPPQFDGHPEDFLAGGEQLTYSFPQRQEAAMLWYHDHTLGTTRLNVYAGLAAPYLLRDRWDTGRPGNPLGLPAGEFELPLVLQEKIFTDDGHQSVRSTPLVPEGSWEGGAIGDRGLVNGVVWPEATVARGLYRLRILNGGSYSVWNLFFSNRMRFWVVGNDSGLLDAPVPTTRVRIGPAERLDVLVDFGLLAGGETVELRNDDPAPSQAAIIGEQPMALFCRFRASAATGFTGAVPTRLRGGNGQPPALSPVVTPTRVRNLTLSQAVDMRMPPAMMSLNNLTYMSDDIEKPVQGTSEVWNLMNVSPDPHDVHIHLISFRILNRQRFDPVTYQLLHPIPSMGTRWAPSPDAHLLGTPMPPAAWESGPKDTVRCDGYTVTRVVIHWPTAEELGFDPDAVFTPQGATAAGAMGSMPGMGSSLQGYLWHCHMLDHEDHDMMLRYRLVAG